jgi:uncharacterized protein YggE
MERIMRSRASIVALIAVAGVWLAAPARADEPASIAVTGEASITVPPDLAQIDGGVTTEAKTAREASDVNNTAMAKVLAALKASGLEPKNMQTSRLSLQPQYQQSQSNRNTPAVIIGYRASNRVTVQVRDVSKVAGVIDTLVAAGANDIGGINFSVTTASKLLDNARTEALADARRKADIYAKAAGVSLGAPLSIAEGSAVSPVMYRRMAAAPAPASVPIAQGEETLHIAVSVVWAIKPAM